MSAQQVRNQLCEAVGDECWFAIPFPVRARLVFAAHRLLEERGAR